MEIDLNENNEIKKKELENEEKKVETKIEETDIKRRFINGFEEFLDYLPFILVLLPNLVKIKIKFKY